VTRIEESLIALAGAGSDAGTAAGPPRARLYALVEAADDAGPIADDGLGARNQRLLRLHARLCGGALQAWAPCPAGRERNEFDVPAADLLALPSPDSGAVVEVAGSSFRLPCIADLEGLDLAPGAEPVAWQIARTCRLSDERPLDAALVEAVGQAFDAADPAADVAVHLDCAHCGEAFPVSVDLAVLVGEACARAAEGLLREVDTMACAYGWSEGQILGLPPERRRRYVELIATRRAADGPRPRLVERPA
jgi:hypothetical protein